MTPSQRQAWFAIGLGPVWLERSGQAQEPASTERSEPAKERGSAERAESIHESALPGSSSALPAERDGPPAMARTASMAEPDEWGRLQAEVDACRACPLGSSRKKAVAGHGPSNASCLVIGEAPGAEEDRQGLPFVGRAGALLDQMLASVGLDRSRDVYVTNTLKCRPPDNRNPEPLELARCRPFLERQIAMVQPRLVVLLGRFAAHAILDTDAAIASLRGRVHEANVAGQALRCVVTYHPAYLLRNPLDKPKAWRDWVAVRSTLNSAQPA
jgi:uracil-DNA glycosylase family 4